VEAGFAALKTRMFEAMGNPVGSPAAVTVTVEGMKLFWAETEVSASTQTRTSAAVAAGATSARRVKGELAGALKVPEGNPVKVRAEAPVAARLKLWVPFTRVRLLKAEEAGMFAPAPEVVLTTSEVNSRGSVPLTVRSKVIKAIPVWPKTAVERAGDPWTKFKLVLRTPFMMERAALTPGGTRAEVSETVTHWLPVV